MNVLFHGLIFGRSLAVLPFLFPAKNSTLLLAVTPSQQRGGWDPLLHREKDGEKLREGGYIAPEVEASAIEFLTLFD